MIGEWSIILLVQVLIWMIVLFEWKNLKKASKANKITFASILILSMILSFAKLEYLPGPITLLHYIFGPWGWFME
ncbi:hypothetical protein [Mesobacillus maritimus]|uniref:Uncharacterized protein n=1 Tax=Mesobacillus maritimus TaxID=1643336 RepID=A0ABS7K7K3_9BACI|nr:hypothetical protein [Mesobacillus maritimus]MBY0098229.1 hypothetical protein [Mesobacillus maritimus]